VIGADRVLEAGVRGAGINEIRQAELADISEPLKNIRVDEPESQLIDPDIIPQRVAQDFKSHARPGGPNPGGPRS